MNIIEKIYWRTYYTIKDFIYEIKYAYQRVVRGYDDRITWGLEEELAKIINKVTFNLAENSYSYPNGLTEKKWKEILQQISFGFGSYIEMRSGMYTFKDKEYKQLEKDFKKGMKLFVKYYGNLWD